MILMRLPVGALITSGSLAAFAIAVALAYEAFAYVTGLVPTISGITSEQLLTHPVWGVVVVFVLGVLVGALVTHLTHWTP